MTTSPLLERFEREYVVLNQISAARARRQVGMVHEFERWLGRPATTTTADDLRRWMSDEIADGRKASTVRFKLMTLKPFLRWARQAGHLDLSQWVDIAEVTPPRGSGVHKPRPYTRKELDAFYAALDTKFPTRSHKMIARYKSGASAFKRVRKHGMRLQVEAIVALALYQGMRADEIHVASPDELHPDNAYIVVHGKREDQNEKLRWIPYHDAAREAISAWFAFRRMMAPRHDATWLALRYAREQQTVPMSRDSLGRLMGRIPPGFELHRFRHTCGTERLRSGMELEVLKEFLGHSHIAQTLGYAELVREDLQRATKRTDSDFAKRVGRRKALAA